MKNYVDSVGIAAVREFSGVAHGDGRKPLYFTSGRYAAGALDFSTRVGVAMFKYDIVSGPLRGANNAARDYTASGLN